MLINFEKNIHCLVRVFFFSFLQALEQTVPGSVEKKIKLSVEKHFFSRSQRGNMCWKISGKYLSNLLLPAMTVNCTFETKKHKKKWNKGQNISLKSKQFLKPIAFSVRWALSPLIAPSSLCVCERVCLSVCLSMSHSPLPGLGAEHWAGYEGINCASVHHTI